MSKYKQGDKVFYYRTSDSVFLKMVVKEVIVDSCILCVSESGDGYETSYTSDDLFPTIAEAAHEQLIRIQKSISDHEKAIVELQAKGDEIFIVMEEAQMEEAQEEKNKVPEELKRPTLDRDESHWIVTDCTGETYRYDLGNRATAYEFIVSELMAYCDSIMAKQGEKP